MGFGPVNLPQFGTGLRRGGCDGRLTPRVDEFPLRPFVPVDQPVGDQRVAASFQGNNSWTWAVWVRDPSAKEKEYIVVGFGPDGKVTAAYRGWESKVGG